MTGTTPGFGWIVPSLDGSDLIDEWPGIAVDGFTSVENAILLAADSKTSTDLYNTWQVGISVMAITASGASSGGWPEGSQAQLLTVRRGAAVAGTAQIWFAHAVGAPHAQFRYGSASGWSSWVRFASLGTPTATASGTYTFSTTGLPQTATITFPAGRFSSAPNVVATTHDRDAVFGVSAISSSGFTLLLGDNGGSPTLNATQTWSADWIAMTNNP